MFTYKTTLVNTRVFQGTHVTPAKLAIKCDRRTSRQMENTYVSSDNIVIYLYLSQQQLVSVFSIPNKQLVSCKQKSVLKFGNSSTIFH